MAKAAKPIVESLAPPSRDLAALPERVAALRDKILEACASGDIEKLRVPIEWAETPPSFARSGLKPRGFGPIIDFLKERSFDGTGAEWLAIARAVFSAPYVVQTRGPFVTYVWPSYARVDAASLKGLSDGERAQMWACVRFADIGKQAWDGRPVIQHAGIGADGTWHYFWPVDHN